MIRNENGPAAGGAAAGPMSLSTPPRDFEAASQSATSGERTASATAYAPSGPRGRWVLVVTDCPFCGQGPHVHLSDEPSGVRRAGCGRGRYQLVADERHDAQVLAFEPARLQRMERRAAELAVEHIRVATGHDVSWVFDQQRREHGIGVGGGW
ncbi:hypothetical protein [Pseudonocardia xishanensis]|uniref:Uncharacterized protein n=1 Tax=Pseudonocardia xishanensis TaxID=630995 RepID=A0ABP8S2J2_9PSEU